MADGDTIIIPTHPLIPRPLGRLGAHHDPRNRAFRALVTPPPRSGREFPQWWSSVVYDQGNESSCTAQAAVGLLNTSPHMIAARADRPSYDEPAERHELYRAAQTVDPWPGENYEGSSTDAPFRILRDRGVISSWRWLFGEAEVREWVRWFGPCAVGTEWLWQMFAPGADGFLDVSGDMAGGHAYRIAYYSPRRDAYRVVNSWGRGWGQNGRGWIAATDLRGLLARNGEAVVIG